MSLAADCEMERAGSMNQLFANTEGEDYGHAGYDIDLVIRPLRFSTWVIAVNPRLKNENLDRKSMPAA